PEGVIGGIVAVLPRREAGMMPVGEGASAGMSGEVRRQPLELRRAGSAAANIGAVRVEDDDVPGAELVAVIAPGPLAGGGTEIIEVTGGARRSILVIARRRAQQRAQPSPRRMERRQVLRQSAVEVLVVSQQQHGVETVPDQQVRRRSLAATGSRAIAAVEVRIVRIAGDVSRGGDDGIGGPGSRGEP